MVCSFLLQLNRKINSKFGSDERMKKKLIIIFSIVLVITLIIFLCILYVFNYIPHKKYTNKDFNIKTYVSNSDKDNDGVDDQTDILNNVRKYISTKPKYKSKY